MMGLRSGWCVRFVSVHFSWISVQLFYFLYFAAKFHDIWRFVVFWYQLFYRFWQFNDLMFDFIYLFLKLYVHFQCFRRNYFTGCVSWFINVLMNFCSFLRSFYFVSSFSLLYQCFPHFSTVVFFVFISDIFSSETFL